MGKQFSDHTVLRACGHSCVLQNDNLVFKIQMNVTTSGVEAQHWQFSIQSGACKPQNRRGVKPSSAPHLVYLPVYHIVSSRACPYVLDSHTHRFLYEFHIHPRILRQLVECFRTHYGLFPSG